ncbi:hypothetical protein MRB53_018360 [Persea americana]|uniref:Uncharacterized protein n=1 Tax=Persea americana TaxID=3435 RepID=A0ACC2M786_PERAE|nr:hypothetical protein MRB53_018360 [Persea americana]
MDAISDDLQSFEPSLPLLKTDSSTGLMLENPTFNLHGLMDFSNDGFFPQPPEFLVSIADDNLLGFSNSVPLPQSMSSVGDWNQESKMMELSKSYSGQSPTQVSEVGLKEGGKIIRKNSFGKRRRGRCREKQVEKPTEVVHVRARRGQATDRHSIAERARREKINKRLRKLQDLVPGCYKMMGMTAMLDEIISYVQSLQNQIDFLSMKLSAADSFYNFSLEMEKIERQTTHALKAQIWGGPHFREIEEEEELRFIRGKKLLGDLSSWGIGGPCNYYIEVFDESHLISAVRHCCRHSVQILVIGKGSNCLFDDRGFNGCIILNRIDFIERVGPGAYRVGSGYPFNRLGMQCSKEGFSGLEFAGGIPGTVGGAAFMNAGANGQESADTIENVSIITMDGSHRVLNRSELAFGYRRSCFQQMEDMAAIVAVAFKLTPSVSAMEWQRTYLERSRKSQPLQDHSAGSVFRNPALGSMVSAAELIEKTGLKGLRVGGAKVSDLHANFLINCDGSTSRDMHQLIDLVKEKLLTKKGIASKRINLLVKWVSADKVFLSAGE